MFLGQKEGEGSMLVGGPILYMTYPTNAFKYHFLFRFKVSFVKCAGSIQLLVSLAFTYKGAFCMKDVTKKLKNIYQVNDECIYRQSLVKTFLTFQVNHFSFCNIFNKFIKQ